MASSNKTPFLNLNKWLGSDKPKREDFNQDNEKLDSFLNGHIGDLVKHVTAQERELWNSPGYVIGSYLGNGLWLRTIDLGFKPVWGVVFRAEAPAVHANFYETDTYAYMSIFTRAGSSLGSDVADTGFMVSHSIEIDVDIPIAKLNAEGETYVYIAFKERG